MNHDTLPCMLLTGFEPFAGEPVNASWDAVRALHGATVGGHRVVTRCLPTVFADAPAALEAAMRELDPAAVIAVGQADGRETISLERVAINLIDARIPDNQGAQPIDQPVLPGGPAAYFSTLPLKPMLAALHQADIPAEISHTAGTYVCNQLFYSLCHTLREQPRIPAGFVHVPLNTAQAPRHPGMPTLDPDILITALRLIARAAVNPSLAAPGTSPFSRKSLQEETP